MNFANVKGLTIPQGKVTKIELLKDSMRTLLWQAIRYLKGYTIGGNAEVKDGKILGVGDEFAWNQLVVDSFRVGGSATNALTETRLTKGHKYLAFLHNFETIGSDRLDFYAGDVDGGAFVRFGMFISTSSNNFIFTSSVNTNGSGADSAGGLWFYNPYWSSNTYRFNLFDLTAMGIADTISTIEDFKTYLKSHSMMDKDATEIPYFGYDSGSVKTSLPIVASNQSGSESTTYPLLVSSPLYKAGSVADVAKFGEGVTRKVGKKVFDGTEEWRLYTAAALGADRDLIFISIPGLKLGVSFIALCNHYPIFNGAWYSAPIGSISKQSNVYDVIMYNSVPNSYSLDSWKAHLADLYAQGNPLTIIYELAEPVTEAVDLPKIVNYEPTILTTDTEVVGDITIEE